MMVRIIGCQSAALSSVYICNVILMLLIARCYAVVDESMDAAFLSPNHIYTPSSSQMVVTTRMKTWITCVTSVGIAMASSAYYNYRFNERCDVPWIHQDPDAVRKSLNIEWKKRVFGQDLALKVIRNMLVSHLKRVAVGKSKKPLVMSFHGGIGTGKTFVSTLLANVLYRKGENSSFVRRLHLVDMLSNSKTIDQKRNLIKNEIRTIVQLCSRALIIFDEVDKLEEGVIDVLFPYFDEQQSVGNINFRNTIFIFSSNVGARKINHEACIQFNKTDQSSQFDTERFYHIVRQASYDGLESHQSSSESLRGGFATAKFIKHCLVNSFVPFLPLQMNHVLKCMDASIAERDDIMKILKHKPALKSKFFSFILPKISKVSPPGCTKVFSVNGCKRVTSLFDQEMDSFFYSD